MTTFELTPVGAAAGSSASDGACCSPLVTEPMDLDRAERLAASFKALADPTRLRLLSIVAKSDGEEACVCDLIDPVGLSQPTVSHHLKILATAGFLERSKRGTWAYYKLVPGALDRMSQLLADG
ncbi:ArsR/SmtB family transcription factor [Agromyces marinus]|uniref:Transcriptional regulator, ArsR family protein n=1 Tax=Agromyces marinus TaxID=1389020 RepID=A0ABN6YC41_9MICO|nr:metalloregulator ArsR/SmtB family transcription factor [Agromyces marinus]UIP59954.1 Transcriptional repressor SmtB [Agromyces marinus]BDZ54942.1 putative transcriptional regulator, ArsR family protein [Agromyces marinus]